LTYGVDGIEIDVHRCKTGEIVVIHDETLDRTTDGRGNVIDYTWQELQKIKTEEGFAIPTLEEVLQLMDAGCELNIELKGEKTVLPVLELIEKYVEKTSWEYGDFVISSFDHSQLFDLKKESSKFKIAVLTEENITAILPVAKELEAYALNPPVKTITKSEVEMAHKKGYKVYVWTVNTEEQILKSEMCNVDTIITDFPNFAV